VIQTQVIIPSVNTKRDSKQVEVDTVPPLVEKTVPTGPPPKLDTKTAPIPRSVTKPTDKTDLHKSYLDAFLKNDTMTMKTIRTQAIRERDSFLSQKQDHKRENRRNNVVVIGFPRDSRITTKDQYISFLTSLDILSSSDSAHITNITQRDSRRTGKLILTISFDTRDQKQRVLANSAWVNNKCLPVWGISVFSDMTFQERLQQKSTMHANLTV